MHKQDAAIIAYTKINERIGSSICTINLDLWGVKTQDLKTTPAITVGEKKLNNVNSSNAMLWPQIKLLPWKECSQSSHLRTHPAPLNDYKENAIGNQIISPKNLFVCSFHFRDKKPPDEHYAPELCLMNVSFVRHVMHGKLRHTIKRQRMN